MSKIMVVDVLDPDLQDAAEELMNRRADEKDAKGKVEDARDIVKMLIGGYVSEHGPDNAESPSVAFAMGGVKVIVIKSPTSSIDPRVLLVEGVTPEIIEKATKRGESTQYRVEPT